MDKAKWEMKKPRELEGWQLDEEQKATLVGILAHHLRRIDPNVEGVLMTDLLASLYPPRANDGFDEARHAIEKLTRSVEGLPPDSARVGRVFGAYKNRTLPGGLQLRRGSIDMVHNCFRWVAAPDDEGAPIEAPVLSATESHVVKARPRRTPLEDAPLCRARIERFVGEWLLKNRPMLPGSPGPFDAISTAGCEADDVAFLHGAFALVIYIRDLVTDPHPRMPEAHWKALARAKERGATIYICLCADEPGYLSFDTYESFLDQSRTIDRGVVRWPAELPTWFGNFKEIVPHIMSLRTTRSSAAETNGPPLSRFVRMMLSQEPELVAAAGRGWLLSTMPPEEGLTDCWAKHCEAVGAIDLYVCTYAHRRGPTPTVLYAGVRLDLCPAGLAFSDIQLAATLLRVADILAESQAAPDKPLARMFRSENRTTCDLQHQHAVVTTPRIVSFRCSAALGLQIGAALYEQACALRPKKLAAIR